MNTKQVVDKLWQEMREAINVTYESAPNTASFKDDKACLRDYAENISMSDDLAGLLGRETANERQHRRNRPSVPGFSNETAAKVILMDNMREGALRADMPQATEFLVFRQTAAEAHVLGFLIRENLSAEWREQILTLDYSKLMKVGE